MANDRLINKYFKLGYKAGLGTKPLDINKALSSFSLRFYGKLTSNNQLRMSSYKQGYYQAKDDIKQLQKHKEEEEEEEEEALAKLKTTAQKQHKIEVDKDLSKGKILASEYEQRLKQLKLLQQSQKPPQRNIYFYNI